MTTQELVTKYNAARDKEGFWAKRNTIKYIPYEQKIAYCKKIVDATSKTNIEDKIIYKQDSPIRYMLFAITLINLYTDVDIDVEKSLEEFNILEEHEFTPLLIGNSIPEKEYETFETILNMVADDVYENTRSNAGIVDGIISSIMFLTEEIKRQQIEGEQAQVENE